MIKAKSVYEKIDCDDGIRILTMRKWPRGVGWEKNKIDVKLEDLGPSRELLDDWNEKKIDFNKYTKRYRREMEQPKQKSLIKLLAFLSQHSTITVLCWEKEDKECHRRLLKPLIEEARARF